MGRKSKKNKERKERAYMSPEDVFKAIWGQIQRPEHPTRYYAENGKVYDVMAYVDKTSDGEEIDAYLGVPVAEFWRTYDMITNAILEDRIEQYATIFFSPKPDPDKPYPRFPTINNNLNCYDLSDVFNRPCVVFLVPDMNVTQPQIDNHEKLPRYNGAPLLLYDGGLHVFTDIDVMKQREQGLI